MVLYFWVQASAFSYSLRLGQIAARIPRWFRDRSQAAMSKSYMLLWPLLSTPDFIVIFQELVAQTMIPQLWVLLSYPVEVSSICSLFTLTLISELAVFTTNHQGQGTISKYTPIIWYFYTTRIPCRGLVMIHVVIAMPTNSPGPIILMPFLSHLDS